MERRSLADYGALKALVLAALDDPAVRGVLADWLEERGCEEADALRRAPTYRMAAESICFGGWRGVHAWRSVCGVVRRGATEVRQSRLAEMPVVWEGRQIRPNRPHPALECCGLPRCPCRRADWGWRPARECPIYRHAHVQALLWGALGCGEVNPDIAAAAGWIREQIRYALELEVY